MAAKLCNLWKISNRLKSQAYSKTVDLNIEILFKLFLFIVLVCELTVAFMLWFYLNSNDIGFRIMFIVSKYTEISFHAVFICMGQVD